MFSLQNSVSIQSPAILAMGPAYCYQLHFTVLTVIGVVLAHVTKTHEGRRYISIYS